MRMQASAALSKMPIRERNAAPALEKMPASVDLLAITIFAPTAEPQPEVVVVTVGLLEMAIGGPCAGLSQGADLASADSSKKATTEPIAER